MDQPAALGLLETATIRTLPREALDLALGTSRDLLVYGTLPALLQHQLEGAGARLCHARTVEECMERLSRTRYDAVLVDPTAPRSRVLVRTMLSPCALATVSDQMLARARRTNRKTPIFALPFPDDLEYGVILGPSLLVVQRTDRVSLRDAILRLDLGR